MVLEYLNKLILVEKAPSLTEDEIAKIIGTIPSWGTEFIKVALLTDAVTSAVPSVEFVPQYASHTLLDLLKELDSGGPAIVWIYFIDESGAEYVHAVVVIGIDTNESRIWYNDPTLGPKNVSLDEFLRLWEKDGVRMVKVKIGRLLRKTLEDWTPKEGDS